QYSKARDVREPSFERMRMLRGDAPSAAGRHADNQWDGELPAGHMRNRGGIVDNLVEREKAEVAGHDLDDGPHAHHRRANARANNGAFGQRRVPDAFFAELFEHPLRHRVAAAIATDILSHQEDARIFDQRLAQRLFASFAIRQAQGGGVSGVAHAGTSFMTTKRSTSSTGSSAPRSAKATASAIS